MRSVLLVGLCVLVTVGCEGPRGPTGPEGPQGIPGNVVRYTTSGTVPTGGTVFHELPAGIGALGDLPVATCYLSPDGVSWFTVLDGYTATAPYCTIEVITTEIIAVQLTQAPANWSYIIVVVH